MASELSAVLSCMLCLSSLAESSLHNIPFYEEEQLSITRHLCQATSIYIIRVLVANPVTYIEVTVCSSMMTYYKQIPVVA